VKLKLLLPILLMFAFAATRWPGLMPPNFSAAYALVFCAGVFFPKRLAWWLPMLTMFVTDLLLNRFYYHTHLFNPEMIGSYIVYGALIWLGQRLGPKASFVSLLCGGILGAVLFYLVTNTFSWLENPEYAKNLSGWIVALTKGTNGWPETWRFFRDTLLSGGLFTGLFAGAMKLMEALEPAEEKEPEEQPEEQPQQEPEEAKA